MAVSQSLSTAELLFQCAERMGLEPIWITPNGLFAVSIDGQEHYINTAVSSLNLHHGASLARNKYRTRLILERQGILNIPFTVAHTLPQAVQFLHQHGTIIAKPIRGAGAQDINIINQPTQLSSLDIADYILEQYIPGTEMRYLLLNDEVIAVHRSDYGTCVAEDRHLERISYQPERWDSELVLLSLRIARIFGLRFAAVDFMIDEKGQAFVLEVNTRPGLKWFHAPSRGPTVDIAQLLLEATTSALRSTNHFQLATDYQTTAPIRELPKPIWAS